MTVHLLFNCYKLEKLKGNAIPVQAWTALRVPEGSSFPDFMIRRMKVVKLSALRTGRLPPQKEIFLVLISVTE
jgi:hypothetical protein